MQLFTWKLKKFWNGWEIRVMILLSLFLQIILFLFGSRRKHTKRIWIRILVWSAYMIADPVANFALGNIAIARGDYHEDNYYSGPSHLLLVFWVPFLLLHLGGPDTITAYSLEDNELWLRHLLGFIVQVVVAFYVLLESWSSSNLNFLAIPIFVSGTFKYGERIFVLRASSTKQFEEQLLSPPDPGPEVEMSERSVPVAPEEGQFDPAGLTYSVKAARLLLRFLCLYAGLILGPRERTESYHIIKQGSAKDAFKLIECELGFMYDKLYTKTLLVLSPPVIYVRCITLLSSVSALVVFIINVDKKYYKLVDIFITYLLLIGAAALEISAFIVFLFSGWSELLIKPFCDILLRRGGNASSSSVWKRHHKRWSGSMAQYNLLSVCLKDSSQTKFIDEVQKILSIGNLIGKYRCLTCEDVNVDLKELIFSQLSKKAEEIEGDRFSIELCKKLLAFRGDDVLERWKCPEDLIQWSIVKVEFEHSLLIWHIATDICHHEDFDRLGHKNDFDRKYQRLSKRLSDYMLYLLVHCPAMLPKGIGEIKYRDTCAEAIRFFKRQTNLTSTKLACDALLKMNTDAPQLEDIKGDTSQSVLFFGCRLAKELQLLETQNGWNYEQKWEMMSEVWVEMLAYAANQCDWKEHGQQLRRGGEIGRIPRPKWYHYLGVVPCAVCVLFSLFCACCCCCLCRLGSCTRTSGTSESDGANSGDD